MAAHTHEDPWWIDSGASSHRTSHAEYFSKLDATHDGIIYRADSTPNSIKGKGDIPIQLGTGMKKTLGNVLLVTKNLISVGAMTEKGLKVEFEGQQCLIKDPKNCYKVLAKGQKHGKLFKLEGSPSTFSAIGNSESSPIIPTELWHKRIGKVCEACCLGKQSRSKFPRSQIRTHATIDLIYADVCESVHIPSLGGHTYYVSFTDDYSRYTWVYFMKSKAEVFQIFKHFHMMVKTMTGRRIKILRLKNRGEFLSKEFSQYLLQHGIKRQLTCSYTPQQNGVAEMKNRTLFDTAKCMLKDKGLSNCYWAEAINTKCYLMNQSSTKILKGITPYEAFHKVKPKVHHLRVFGCLAFTHVPDEKRKKLDDKSRKCIFLGYSDVSKAYKLYDPIKKESFISRDVIFDENASFKLARNVEDTSSPTPLKIDVPSNIQEEIIEEIDEEDEEHQAALRRSSRTQRQPQRLTYQRGSNEAMVEDVQYKLSKEFEMKDLGELHYILGIEVSRLKNGDIFISQQKYLHSVLDRFGMISSKQVSTPMKSTLKLTKDEHGVPYDGTL
ncbi:hypothetical protein L7F22_069303 [Adiantum nelumboides]|nr:hypothetical protein [Adiantum nelumboides]